MLSVFLIIGLTILILGIIYGIKNLWRDEFNIIIPFIGAIIVVITIISMLFNIDTIIDNKTTDQKIVLYEAENSKIEEEIGSIISHYMQWEADTYKNINTENIITLVNLYPELKSDELIKTQIELYIQNNATIKQLKSYKLETIKAKWWLYFG